MHDIDRTDIALVDFQYCHGNHKSIFIKELSYMCGASIVPNNFFFRPPFNARELTVEARKTNAYCKKYVNGLDWMDGNIDYNDVEDVLKPLNDYKYIFVVGKEKKKFLQKYLVSTIINLENKMSLKSCQNYSTNCFIHLNSNFKCAINNIFKLFVFIEKKWNNVGDLIYNSIKT